MTDTRHPTVKNIIDSVFNAKIGTLHMEDLLSNYISEHGDENFLDSEFLNDLASVAHALEKQAEKIREVIAESYDYEGYYERIQNTVGSTKQI